MKKHVLMPLTQSLLILAIALASADLGFARADAPSGKNSLKSTTVVAVDPVAFNFVDGEPIHYTVYKTVPKNP